MHDLAIIGAGVAGMTASLYASRYKISHLLFGQTPGGQGALASTVENYPGYLSISGPELMQKFIDQTKHYGVEIIQKQIDRLANPPAGGKGFEVAAEGEVWSAKSLILAMGAAFRHLNIPGEGQFVGKGVSYCTTCDAPFFKDKVVAVVGGGDSAVTGALHAAAFAQKVFLIHRRDQYRAEPTWVEKMRATGKVAEVLNNEVTAVKGTNAVEEITLKTPYQGNQALKVSGLFIEIGQVPSSALAQQLGVALDERQYVRVTPAMATNVNGVFAAGDLAAIEKGILFRQFVTAAADGARAAASVYQFLHQGQAPAPAWGQPSGGESNQNKS